MIASKEKCTNKPLKSWYNCSTVHVAKLWQPEVNRLHPLLVQTSKWCMVLILSFCVSFSRICNPLINSLTLFSQSQSKNYGQHAYGEKSTTGCVNFRITRLRLVSESNWLHCWSGEILSKLLLSGNSMEWNVTQMFVKSAMSQHLVCFHVGSHWVSLHRCHHDSTEEGRMDTSFGTSCCSMFFDQRRLMDQLGGRTEGEEHSVLTAQDPPSFSQCFMQSPPHKWVIWLLDAIPN